MESISKRAVVILLITNGLVLTAGAMLGPIYALFVGGIGGDPFDAGYAFAVYSLTAGLVTFAAGFFSDRIRESELILVAGYTLMGLGFLLYLTVDSLMELLLVQVVIGVGEAIYLPAYDMLLSRHSSPMSLGKVWGSWEALNYFTGALGAAVGAFIAARLGFDPLFIIMGGLCLGGAIYIFLLPRTVL